jgi:hypothetical protein
MGSLLISIGESIEFLTIALVSKGEETFEDMTLVLILPPYFQFLEDNPESVLDASFLASLNQMACKLVQVIYSLNNPKKPIDSVSPLSSPYYITSCLKLDNLIRVERLGFCLMGRCTPAQESAAPIYV